MAGFAPAAIFAQQTPSQPAPQQTPAQPAPTPTPTTPAQPAPQQTPAQPAPAQTPPAQPAPQQTPAQPAPTPAPTTPATPAPQQTPAPAPAPTTPATPPATPAPQQTPAAPTTQPATPEPQPEATGPTTTIEGAVQNVVSYNCGPTVAAMMNHRPAGTTSTGSVSASGAPLAQQPTTTPGAPTTPSAPTPSNAQGCSAVLVITPGVNWAQVEQVEVTSAGENGYNWAAFGGPVRVVVGPRTTVTMKNNSEVSLLDLARGAVVKVDYTMRNDVAVATNINVIWHTGQ